jgi:hypothetical protein
LVLSVVAVLVLCAWWGRHVLKTRRARAASSRPAGAGEAAGDLSGNDAEAGAEPAEASLTRTET